jgi:hypothetical protein
MPQRTNVGISAKEKMGKMCSHVECVKNKKKKVLCHVPLRSFAGLGFSVSELSLSTQLFSGVSITCCCLEIS